LRRIVVDASVVLAGLFKDGTVRDILLNYEAAEFVAPRYLESEVERHLSEVVLRTRKPEATVRVMLEDLLAAIDLLPPEVYSGSMDRAKSVAGRAGCRGDEDYIGLALALDSPVWTLDSDFGRVPGLRTLRTDEIEHG